MRLTMFILGTYLKYIQTLHD